MLNKIQPQIHTHAIGDVEYPYLLYPKDAPTVVLLHAVGFNPWMWSPISKALLQNYQVVAPCFCGHRESDPDQGGLSWLILAEDLCDLLTKLHIDAPCMVGHSMGGVIATIANAIGCSAEKMVLMEPIIFPESLYQSKMRIEDNPLAVKTLARRNDWKDMEEARRYLRFRPLFDNWDEEIFELYLKYGLRQTNDKGIKLSCDPKSEASLFVGSTAYNPLPDLSQIQCPVLVLEGENSDLKNFLDFKQIAASFPNGTHQLIKNTGHLIPMEQPKIIADILLSFL